MTTLVSNKVHLFTGWRDIPKDKPQAFHFMKKLTHCFLDEVKNWSSFYKVVQNLKLENNVFTPKWSSKLIFFNEKKIKKIPLVLDIEN